MTKLVFVVLICFVILKKKSQQLSIFLFFYVEYFWSKYLLKYWHLTLYTYQTYQAVDPLLNKLENITGILS